MSIVLENPDLQVDFAAALVQLRDTFLQEALFATVKGLKLAGIDKELAMYAHDADLSLLASKGLRGEIVFATPVILSANPRLLGYYRLLLGFSQKSFYIAETGVGLFKAMEDKGILSKKNSIRLPELCRALNNAASYLMNSISEISLTKTFLDDLALLTLGPQLRGGANVTKGARGIVIVFDVIKTIVDQHVTTATPRVMEIKNAAGRMVLIEFAPDPDIIIRERLSERPGDFRNIIAIEIKGGTDFSNIHNRIGEAEKSHQKAKSEGYVECWTVVNVDRIDMAMAKKESPSTNRFYRLSQIAAQSGQEYADFESRVVSLTGIPSKTEIVAKKRK
ncbi:MAG: XcyI family restriction endonuclease [Nitrospirales bacterium]|nr:XcyI family restriction endonuclease [Nitrospirales bacterium]